MSLESTELTYCYVDPVDLPFMAKLFFASALRISVHGTAVRGQRKFG